MKTERDIKKALQCCSGIRIYCSDCPYDAIGNCSDTLCADALNLIIEQGREIEKLKAENDMNAQYIRMMGIQSHIKTSNEQVKQAQIDILNKLKDSYGLYYLSALGVKERMLADILNPMIEELENDKRRD